jgi:hypothetical protein
MRRPAAALPTAALAGVALACVLAPALMLTGIHSPLRVAAVLALFALAPGAALLPWLAPRRTATEPALLVGTSLAVSLLATQLMLWAGDWSPRTATCLLAGACLASLLVQLAARARDEVRA